MLDDNTIIPLIVERLPSPSTMAILSGLRMKGWDWDDIESRLDGLAEDIAESQTPFANEAERYTRRLMIAAHAYEVRGLNN